MLESGAEDSLAFRSQPLTVEEIDCVLVFEKEFAHIKGRDYVLEIEANKDVTDRLVDFFDREFSPCRTHFPEVNEP